MEFSGTQEILCEKCSILLTRKVHFKWDSQKKVNFPTKIQKKKKNLSLNTYKQIISITEVFNRMLSLLIARNVSVGSFQIPIPMSMSKINRSTKRKNVEYSCSHIRLWLFGSMDMRSMPLREFLMNLLVPIDE